jgi:hypothetical protein
LPSSRVGEWFKHLSLIGISAMLRHKSCCKYNSWGNWLGSASTASSQYKFCFQWFLHVLAAEKVYHSPKVWTWWSQLGRVLSFRCITEILNHRNVLWSNSLNTKTLT